MSTRVKLDRQGIAQLLKSPAFAAVVKHHAEAIAGDVRAHTDAEVVVDEYTTDRAAASVTIRDVRGKLLEVRDGILTRAAAANGLEVTRRT